MQTITRTHPHRLTQLCEELYAAFPGWIVVHPDGHREALAQVSGDGQTIALYVPDGIDPAAVDAVIAAHIPTAIDKAAVNAGIQAQIDALEKIQGRALREAAIERVGSVTVAGIVYGSVSAYLTALDAQAVALRAKFIP